MSPQDSRPDGAGGALLGEWSVQALRQVLWQRRWLLIAIAAEVFVITGLVTYLRTPQYTASARVLIERATPKVLDAEDVVPLLWNEFEIQRFYQTQYLLLRDPETIKGAFHAHPAVRQAVLETLVPPDEERDPSLPLPDDDDLAAWVRDRITLDQLDYSNVVRVSFRHPDPNVAAAVVNAVVEAYRDFFVQSGLAAREQASEFLEKEIEETKSRLARLEIELADARDKLNVPMPADGQGVSGSRLAKLDAELTEAKTRRAEAEARLEAYRSSSPAGIDRVSSDPTVLHYREELGRLERELAELESRVGPGWPRVAEIKQAIEETRRNLARNQDRLYQQILEEARAEVDLARRNESNLAELLDRELRDSSRLQKESTTYQKLAAEYDQTRQALARLIARREEVRASEDYKDVLSRQVTIVARATPPEAPSSPRVKLNLAVGGFFGLLLGIGAVFLAEALDNKIRSAQQLQQLLGLPVLGAIPRVEAPKGPRLAFSRKNREAARKPMLAALQHDAEEAFRALRSALLLSKAGHPPRSLLVTSALPGEGKSTIASNLARTLASFGHRTVLIDADLRHPRLHRVFRVSSSRGLTNILASSDAAETILAPTRFDNLKLIPGGPCPPDPATLLHRERLEELVRTLREDLGFEFVIVDTPPLLVFADAFNIVPATEGTILVGRALETPKDAIRQAYEALARIKAPLLGVVLNGEVSEEQSGSYYRYYHYRRGYYRKERERRQAEVAPRAERPRRRPGASAS